METIELYDTIIFRDDNGTFRYGVVWTLVDHEFAAGQYQVSVVGFQGLVSVSPKDIMTVRKAVH